MASFVPAFLLLTLMGATCPSASQSTDSADTMCHDWGEFDKGAVSVLEGEAAWLSCPLFSHPSVYNYSSTQSTGHNLFWYQILDGQDLEQPIRQSSRFSKHRERLWLLPACAEDSGQYICLLRNKSFCSKIAMRLKVFRWDQLTPASNCEPLVAMVPTQSLIPLQEGETLDCPDLKDAASMSDSSPTVTWSHKCNQHPFWNSDRQQRGSSLRFYTMVDQYEGLYYCTVRFQRGSKQLNFTRAINVTAINPTRMSKIPVILHPHTDPVFVKSHSKVTLACQANVPFVMDEPSWEVWWTVDGQTLEKLSDHRFSQSNRVLKNDHKDLTVENTLVIHDFQSEDLQRRFNCSVKNAKGFESRQALLEAEASLPSVELGCVLGVTLVLMLLLFVVYHVFWLELLLLYRSWFGTDERHTDEKDFDVYISYARSGEEEQFVLSTLRRVLENEFGYSVCIFDRDSLPGGTITDETLSFVARSRRLLVVVSPGYASQGSQALLELKAGLQGMALGGHLRVILLQYKPVQRQDLVRELRKAQVALALVRWQGEKSKELSSRFWKRLRVELPVRRGPCRGQGASSTEVALLRLTSQNSTNSQTGLINTA